MDKAGAWLATKTIQGFACFAVLSLAFSPLIHAQQSDVYLEECDAAMRAAIANPPDHPLCVEGVSKALYVFDGVSEWIKLEGQLVQESGLDARYVLAKTDPGDDRTWIDVSVVSADPLDDWPAALENQMVEGGDDLDEGTQWGGVTWNPQTIFYANQITPGAVQLHWRQLVSVPASRFVNRIIATWAQADTGQTGVEVEELINDPVGPEGYYTVNMQDGSPSANPLHLEYYLADYEAGDRLVLEYKVSRTSPGASSAMYESVKSFLAVGERFFITHATCDVFQRTEEYSAGTSTAAHSPWDVTVRVTPDYCDVSASIEVTADKRLLQFKPVIGAGFDQTPTGRIGAGDKLQDQPVTLAKFELVRGGEIYPVLTQLQAETAADTVSGFVTGERLDQAFVSKVVDDLVTGGVDKALSAEQGKALKTLIDGLGERVSVADNAAMAADTASPDGTTFFVVDDGGTTEWALYQRIGGVDTRVLGQDDLIAALLALTDAQATDRTDTTLGLVAGGKQLSDAIESWLNYERVETNGQTLQPWGRYLFNASGSTVVTTAQVADGTVDGQMLWIANNAATTSPNGVRVDGKFYVPAFDAVITTSITPQDVWLPLIWNNQIAGGGGGWIYEDFARGPELWTDASSGGGLAPNATYLAKTTGPTIAVLPEIIAWKMGMWFAPSSVGQIQFILNNSASQVFVLPDGSESSSGYQPGPDVIYIEFVADNDGVNPKWVIYEQTKPFSVGEWQPGEAVTTQTERIAPRVSDGVLRLWRSDSGRTTGATFDQAEQDEWTDLGGYTSPGRQAYLIQEESNQPTGGTTSWRNAGGVVSAVPHITDGDTRNGDNTCSYAGASVQWCDRNVPDTGILDQVTISAENIGRVTSIALTVTQDGRTILSVADIVPDFTDGAGYADIVYPLPYPIISDGEDVRIRTSGLAQGAGAVFRIAEIGFAGGVRVARAVIQADDGTLKTSAGVDVTPDPGETLHLDLLPLSWPGYWEQSAANASEYRLLGVPTEQPAIITQTEAETLTLVSDVRLGLTGERLEQAVNALVDAPIVRQPDTTELPYRTTNVSVDTATYVLPVAPITDRIVGLSIQAGHTVTLPAPFGVIVNDTAERQYRAFAYNGAAWEMYSAAGAVNTAPQLSSLFTLDAAESAAPHEDTETVITQLSRLVQASRIAATAAGQDHEWPVATNSVRFAHPLPLAQDITLQLFAGTDSYAMDILQDGTTQANAVDAAELGGSVTVEDRGTERVIEISAVGADRLKVWPNVIGDPGSFMPFDYAFEETADSVGSSVITYGAFHGKITAVGNLTFTEIPTTTLIEKQPDNRTFRLQGGYEYVIQGAFSKNDNSSHVSFEAYEDGVLAASAATGGANHWKGGSSWTHRAAIPAGTTRDYTFTIQNIGGVVGLTGSVDIEAQSSVEVGYVLESQVADATNAYHRFVTGLGTVDDVFTPSATGTYVVEISAGYTGGTNTSYNLGTAATLTDIYAGSAERISQAPSGLTEAISRIQEFNFTKGVPVYIRHWAGGGSNNNTHTLNIRRKGALVLGSDPGLPTSLGGGSWGGQHANTFTANGIWHGTNTGALAGAPLGNWSFQLDVMRVGEWIIQRYNADNSWIIYRRESYDGGVTWTAWRGV